ncbi:MAG: sulfite exporter TauE/SafE family protein [Pseudomonadota bacterium]
MIRRIVRHPSFLCAMTVWALWLTYMISTDRWALFETYWAASVTMLFGSFIAGATSEGGGAVAFPVFTLVFGIKPEIARDFSVMIQSVGMTAAAIAIFTLKVPVVGRAIIVAALAGACGVIIGLDYIAPLLPGPVAKTLFTAVWLSFGVALFLINRDKKRRVFGADVELRLADYVALAVFGGIGGVITGIVGSGIDIVVFSFLVLALRVSERVATPTSVVLMATNSLTAFAWKGLGFGAQPLAPEAWDLWLCCVPIVVIGAPLGAWFIRSRSREFVVRILYASIVVQYIGALILLPQSLFLLGFNIATVLVGTALFCGMSRYGAGFDRGVWRAKPAAWKRA